MLPEIERAAHLIGTYLEHALEGLGMTQAEAHLLAQLARRGPTSIATLHHEFGRKRSTLTNIIDRLESRGLVRREINRADRRSFVIHLTRSGERAAKQVTAALDQLEGQVVAAVSARDLKGLDAVASALAVATRRVGAQHHSER
ncbi:MAG TPA: MarR family transcriptional regulator [Solirubrobacteraceae bacterium]